MATTPRGIFSPDDPDAYDLTVDWAATADSVDSALDDLEARVPNLGLSRAGTDAARTALAGADLVPGLEFWTTDTRLSWRYDGAKWIVAPGQILGQMESSASPTASGALIGTVVTVNGLAVGQRVRIVSSGVGAALTTAGVVTHAIAVRNNASPVTSSASDKSVTSRSYAPAGGGVVTMPGVSYLFTTTSTAPLTAALFNIAGLVYGVDGQRLMVISA